MWPGHEDQTDSGIGLVAQKGDSNDAWAIKCKLYAENHTVPKSELDSLFTGSGKYPFTQRLIVSTAPLNTRAEEAFMNHAFSPPHTLTLFEIDE